MFNLIIIDFSLSVIKLFEVLRINLKATTGTES